MSAKLFSAFFSELAAKIAHEHDLIVTDVLGTIESYCGSCPIANSSDVSAKKSKSSKEATPKKETKKESPSKNSDGICEGINAAKKERCTFKGKHEHEGKMYCVKHFNQVSKEKSEVVKSKTSKTSVKKSSDDKTEKMVEKLVIDKATTTTRKNKWGNFQTNDGIVIEKDTKKVLGNQLDNGKLGPLTTEQISICEANNWIFDKPEKEKIPTPPPKKSSKKKEASSESEESSDESDVELDLDLDDE